MLRITKLADYGIVLLTQMSQQQSRRWNAPALADESSLPQPMVAKILKLLAKSDLLESHRGVNGGYVLAKPPAQISVVEIITALEGPIAITECIDDGPGDCSQAQTCALSANWNRINLAIRNALSSISLMDMTTPVQLVQLPSRSDAMAMKVAKHAKATH